MFQFKSETNTKLYTSYVLFNSFYKFLSFKFEKPNCTCVFIKNNKNYYAMVHYRLSTNFFVNQLVDVFAYEIFLKNTSLSSNNFSNNSVIVYNLHNIFSNNRLFVFTKLMPNSPKSAYYCTLGTVSELFANANWLEREVSELHGIQFLFKKDLRNLMLQYGDSSAPFRKSSPSIGFRETVYDILSDTVTQVRIGSQN